MPMDAISIQRYPGQGATATRENAWNWDADFEKAEEREIEWAV